MKDIAILIFGWILVVLGTAGILLPLIPGIPLLLGGLIVLARHYVWASRLLARVRAFLSRLRVVGQRLRHWRLCTGFAAAALHPNLAVSSIVSLDVFIASLELFWSGVRLRRRPAGARTRRISWST
jgi:uncharacterized membrane protein YbaN (DUF454 family)